MTKTIMDYLDYVKDSILRMKKSFLKERPLYIAIEGSDGSGKETQSKKLYNSLENTGLKVKLYSFPNYKDNSSLFVKEYLNGKYGILSDVTEYQSSLLFTSDRLVTYLLDMKTDIENNNYDVIIFDRYFASNFIHQGAKIVMRYLDGGSPNSLNEDVLSENSELSKFYDNMFNLEINLLGLPEPDITFYLNMPNKYSKKLRKNRLNKIDGKKIKDIHEANDYYLRVCDKVANYAAYWFGWTTIDCFERKTFFNGLKSREDIFTDIVISIIDISEEMMNYPEDEYASPIIILPPTEPKKVKILKKLGSCKYSLSEIHERLKSMIRK